MIYGAAMGTVTTSTAIGASALTGAGSTLITEGGLRLRDNFLKWQEEKMSWSHILFLAEIGLIAG